MIKILSSQLQHSVSLKRVPLRMFSFQPIARRYFGIGKVTGASRQAMSDVQYPTSLWQMIGNLKNAETGVLVLNGGMLISLVGMSSSDMMVLRECSIIGGLCGLYYNFSRKPPLRPAIAWGALFIMLHIGKLVQLLLDKAPLSFDGEELDLYEIHLNKLPARKYFNLLQFSEKIILERGEILIEENKPYKCINFLVNGEAGVYKKQKHIATVTSNSPRSVFGEISFLKSLKDIETAPNTVKSKKRIENDHLEQDMMPIATAQVIAHTRCSFISINTDDLMILFDRDPAFKGIFMACLTNALVSKLIVQQSKVSNLKEYSIASFVKAYFFTKESEQDSEKAAVKHKSIDE
eukprot:g8895.t1